MRELVVIVSGSTGSVGRAVCGALTAAGARVVALGHDRGRLDALARDVPGLDVRGADLSDPVAVRSLVDSVRAKYARIDGLVHLVGGWRGGSSFAANTDKDWEFLSTGLIDTLRHLTLAIHDDLVASPFGRAVIVSSTAVASPTAGGANYAAAKAATEAWMGALADSFRRQQSGNPDAPVPQTAAAVVFAIKAFVDAPMRAAEPNRRFPGFTDVAAFADRVVGLWAADADAATLNGSRLDLTR